MIKKVSAFIQRLLSKSPWVVRLIILSLSGINGWKKNTTTKRVEQVLNICFP